MSYQDQIIVREKAREVLQKAQEVFGTELPRVGVIFSNRMTKCAGTYSFNRRSGEHKITFSAPIIERNSTADFCADTVIHEIAHFVDRVIHGTTGHNARFYQVMRQLGHTNPSRTHSFETAPSNRKTYSYQCQRCGKDMELGAIRHKKVQTGQANYRHPKCGGGRLKYIG